MQYLGEMLSLGVAVLWTATALFADAAGRRLGAMTLNAIRLIFATIFIALILFFATGSPYPLYAGGKAWYYLALSAVVGYLFGDYCLFSSYLVIGARFGQLFMTLAPPSAAIAAWIMLGERLSGKSWIAMAITLSGIAISILSRQKVDSRTHEEDGNTTNGHKGGHKLALTLPVKGIFLGIGAGVGQGVGLVLSKMGMEHYSADIPQNAPALMHHIMPFAATMIRAIVGAIGFVAIIALRKDLKRLLYSYRDKKGFSNALLTTIFGPFLGVSLSLMAVQYADAGIASTLMALTPVLIILPYSLIYKQKIKLREIIGVVVSMVGVAMFFL